MNVQVPTADGPPPDRPPPARPPPKWLLRVVSAVVVLTAGGVAIDAFSSTDDASPDDPIAGQEVPPAGEPTRPMQEWDLMYFPGAGAFVDVMDHPEATVALARTGSNLSPGAVGSAVWGFDAGDSTWHALELEAADRAMVSSVAMAGSEILVAGSVGEGSPTPALWAGPATGPFRIVDQPFQAGDLHAIRRLDNETVLLGRPIQQRDEPSLPLRTHVVLVGEPGNWTDITPPDAELVTEIVSHNGEWIAVGRRGRDAMAWHSTDGGTTWLERPPALERASLLTDVAVLGGEAYAIALITDTATAIHPTQLFRYIGSWTPAGEPRPHQIGWIAEIGGELVGGVRFGDEALAPQLWQHGTGGRWTALRMALPAGGHIMFTAADGVTVVGSVSGHPAMWRPGASVETVLAPTPADNDRLWERVATLPTDGPFVTFVGDEIVMVASGLESPTTPRLLISRDGVEWDERDLPPGLGFAAIREVAGHRVVVGVQASTVAVGRLEETRFEVLAEFEGQLLSLDTSDDSIIVFTRLFDVTTRHEVPVTSDRPVSESLVSGRPVAIWPLGDGVVVRGESDTFVWPPRGMSVSLDGGLDWTRVDIAPWAVFRVGNEIVVFTGETTAQTFRLQLDPIGLEEITLPPRFASSSTLGLHMFEWADGLVLREADAFEYLAAIDADPVRLELSPSTGFNGVFANPTANGHVVTQEGEDWVLYRWTGRTP